MLIGLYGICNYALYALSCSLPAVEAGPIAGVSSTGIRRMPQKIKSSYKIFKDGVTIKYRRFVVQGDCMTCKGINAGEIIKVRMFTGEIDKKSLIQPGDIVLIYLNDENFRGYKIRAISKILDDEAKTHYYNIRGEEVASSKNHSFHSIIGVVEDKSYPVGA